MVTWVKTTPPQLLSVRESEIESRNDDNSVVPVLQVLVWTRRGGMVLWFSRLCTLLVMDRIITERKCCLKKTTIKPWRFISQQRSLLSISYSPALPVYSCLCNNFDPLTLILLFFYPLLVLSFDPALSCSLVLQQGTCPNPLFLAPMDEWNQRAKEQNMQQVQIYKSAGIAALKAFSTIILLVLPSLT